MPNTIERILENPRVREFSDERSSGDGYWLYLKAGWRNDNGHEHAIHEDTPEQCLRELTSVEICACQECKRDLAAAFPFWITDTKTGKSERYRRVDEVAKRHQWAFEHILQHDCGSISCGSTVYEVVKPTTPATK